MCYFFSAYWKISCFFRRSNEFVLFLLGKNRLHREENCFEPQFHVDLGFFFDLRQNAIKDKNNPRSFIDWWKSFVSLEQRLSSLKLPATHCTRRQRLMHRFTFCSTCLLLLVHIWCNHNILSPSMHVDILVAFSRASAVSSTKIGSNHLVYSDYNARIFLATLLSFFPSCSLSFASVDVISFSYKIGLCFFNFEKQILFLFELPVERRQCAWSNAWVYFGQWKIASILFGALCNCSLLSFMFHKNHN